VNELTGSDRGMALIGHTTAIRLRTDRYRHDTRQRNRCYKMNETHEYLPAAVATAKLNKTESWRMPIIVSFLSVFLSGATPVGVPHSV
jgi:hypothetical protein